MPDPGPGHPAEFSSNLAPKLSRNRIPGLHQCFLNLSCGLSPCYMSPWSSWPSLAVSTNDLVSWVRCFRWWRHTNYSVAGARQDRFEKHWSTHIHTTSIRGVLSSVPILDFWGGGGGGDLGWKNGRKTFVRFSLRLELCSRKALEKQCLFCGSVRFQLVLFSLEQDTVRHSRHMIWQIFM